MNPFNDNLYMPKYIQIQNYILDKITDNEFKVGEKIPSEYEISKTFDVSRVTANVAIKELATRGVVERIRGKGTFVSVPVKKNKETDRQPMVFSSGIKVNPTSLTERKEHILISHGIIEADPKLCDKLCIKHGSKVYRIIRQVNIDSDLSELDYSYIPTSVLGSHKIIIEKIEEGCLHDYIKENLSITPKYVKIFVNSQSPLDLSIIDNFAISNPANESLFIWDTFVYDAAEGIIALTVTASFPQKNKPFILLEL